MSTRGELYREALAQETAMREEILRLRAALLAWENREASVCPEDVGFVEYIGALNRLLGEAHDALRCEFSCVLSAICGLDCSCDACTVWRKIQAVLKGEKA